MVAAVLDGENQFYNAVRRRGLDRLWAIAYAQAFGTDPLNPHDYATQCLSYIGPEGNSLRWRINEPRALVDQVNIISRGERPSFKCLALNSDFQSIAQVEIAKSIVKYLYEETVGEQREAEIGESAGWFGWGGWWTRWDEDAGDELDVPQLVKGLPEPVPIKEKSGMPKTQTLFPWDYAFDPYAKESMWGIVRERVSKAELLADPRYQQYWPEIEKVNNIRAQPAIAELFAWDIDAITTDDILVRHFYLKPCKAAPRGRYCGIIEGVSEPIWNRECPHPKRIPVVEMAPFRYFGTRFGYAKTWDILALQEAVDELVSQTLSNYMTFGRQNVFVPMGTNFDEDALADGQNIFTVPLNSSPPVALQLSEMPEGVQWLIEFAYARMNSIMGLNEVARGMSDETVKSGTHAALRDALAIRFQSATHAAFITARTEQANLTLDMVKANAKGPFLVEIAGVGEEAYLQQFDKSTVSGVRRVRVVTQSPEMESYASRLEIFGKIYELPIEEREGAIVAIETGDWSKFTEKPKTTDALIRYENEQLLKGIPITPISGEDPFKHIPEHFSEYEKLRSQPTAPPEIVKAFEQHMMETVKTWFMTNPFFAMFNKAPQPPALPGTESEMLQMMGIFPPNTNLEFARATGTAPPPGGGGGGAPGGEPGGKSKDGGGGGSKEQHPSGAAEIPKPAKPPGEKAA